MSDGAPAVPPRLIKSNLRNLVGAHVRAHGLGHYLDFDVVVIPPGRHVTEFPTADAAFHPYQNGSAVSDDGGVLRIRLVPWVIFKINANESLARQLAGEVGGFWKAGVQQIWEIRTWNRTLVVHAPGESSRSFREHAGLPDCPVLPGLAGSVSDLFVGGEDDEALPRVEAVEESWRISAPTELRGDRRLTKSTPMEFVASPVQSGQLIDPYRTEEHLGGLGGLAAIVLGSWTGRILSAAIALVLLTTTIYLVLETRSGKGNSAPTEIPVRERQSAAAERIEVAKATVRAYYRAENPVQRLELVRRPRDVMDSMNRHYGEHPLEREVVRVFGEPRTVTVGDTGFLALPAYLEGRQREIFLEDIGAKGFRIDWESEAGYNPISFPLFLSRGIPDPTVFRVFATESGIYAGAFSSADDHFAVQLHFPNDHSTALAYIARDSPDFPALEKRVTGSYRHRLSLELEPGPEPGSPAAEPPADAAPAVGPQVRIRRLVGDTWLLDDPPR